MGRLRPLPFREIKRRLEPAGFVEFSQKGSHVKLVRRTGEILDTAVVPSTPEPELRRTWGGPYRTPTSVAVASTFAESLNPKRSFSFRFQDGK